MTIERLKQQTAQKIADVYYEFSEDVELALAKYGSTPKGAVEEIISQALDDVLSLDSLREEK